MFIPFFTIGLYNGGMKYLLVVLLAMIVTITTTLFILGVRAGYITFGPIIEGEASITTETPSEWEIERLVNDYKKNANIVTTRHDDRLCKIAEDRLLELNEGFNHDGFKKYYIENNPQADYKSLAENLAESTTRGYEHLTVAKWLKSPTHRANIDLPYTHTCVKANEKYVVQIFGVFEE